MERSKPSVILICMAVGAVAGTTSIANTFRTIDGVVGVATIAEGSSRNGRVSSAASSVNFFPAGAQDNFYQKLRTGAKFPEPLTFSKEENGRITSGAIKYGPGTVSVSSSARSYPTGPSKYSKPVQDNMFIPFPMFNSRSFDPWFSSDVFKPPAPPTPPKFHSPRSWPFSSPFSDPFNFDWQ